LNLLQKQINFREYIKEDSHVENYSLPLFVSFSEKKEELIIQSDIQSEVNNILSAQGNVSVSYKGIFLKADSLIYDKLNKNISAKGNIFLILGDQIFKISELEYSFISEKGYLLDVKGSIKTSTFIENLYSNVSLSDINKLENLLDLEKSEVLNTPGKVENLIFSTDKMTIDGTKWRSKKAVFSNDLLELKQVKIVINSLEAIPTGEKVRFKTSLNYLIFDEKVSIPFWLGERTLNTSKEFFDIENRWTFGYDNLDKDGYFIGRKFNSIDIFDDFVIDLEPQFLIQRSFKGYTKSFVKKDDSITSEKVKRNTSPALSIKKLLVNSSEKSSISGSLIVPIQNFDE